MNKFFMGCLAFVALALMIGRAVAGGENTVNNQTNATVQQMADNANANGVLIIETYTASAVTVPNYNDNNNNNNDMQPLPNDPNVEVAPLDSSAVQQPVMVEDTMLIQETEAGE